MFCHRIVALAGLGLPIFTLLVLSCPLNAQVVTNEDGKPSSSINSQLPDKKNEDDESASSGSSDIPPLITRPIPYPYFATGPSLMGAGYSAFAWRVEGGLTGESNHFVMNGDAAYDNGRQVNDGDQPNPKGHDRYLNAGLYGRFGKKLFTGNCFVGLGWRWNQLSTTNYVKTANRPQIGGGCDVTSGRDFSMRIVSNWVLAGDDWQNGVHGPEFTFSFPSPRERRHWFWRETLGVYRFHETVTERGNVQLTQSQRADRSTMVNLNFSIIYRF